MKKIGDSGSYLISRHSHCVCVSWRSGWHDQLLDGLWQHHLDIHEELIQLFSLQICEVEVRAPGPFSFNLGHILHYFFEWGVRSASAECQYHEGGEKQRALTHFFYFFYYVGISSALLHCTPLTPGSRRRQSRVELPYCLPPHSASLVMVRGGASSPHWALLILVWEKRNTD